MFLGSSVTCIMYRTNINQNLLKALLCKPVFMVSAGLNLQIHTTADVLKELPHQLPLSCAVYALTLMQQQFYYLI